MGHRQYVAQMQPGERLWLWTKPFSAPPNYELAECLHTFAHVVDHLNLGLRAQVLDVGCGPGWMSELLARCGYWVTGVDISEDMVEIARKRVERLPDQVAEGLDAVAEFHAMPVREIPWTNRFDAAVLYDTMHHFDDELETLRVLQRSLVPGGTIFIREGARPDAGSEAEQNLISEMRERRTLESPFDPPYLLDVVRRAGFEDVRRLIQVEELVDVADLRHPLRAVSRYLRYRRGGGDINVVVARKPVEAGVASNRENFSARIEPLAPWQEGATAEERVRSIRITNTGRAFWPTASAFPYPQGVVTVAPFQPGPNGERVELGRVLLPRGVSPGEAVDLVVRLPREVVARSEVRIDAVREGLAWFSELGSEPLILNAEE